VALARQARSDLVLEIAGGGDDRGRLERLARALGLGDVARFLGFVTEAEKRRLLRRAWAVVLASPKEGWGISNMEAAACATHALALADRMLALAADPGLVTRLGSGARAFAEQFSWERAARATEAHLHRVL